jgi:hypothetical protein
MTQTTQAESSVGPDHVGVSDRATLSFVQLFAVAVLVTHSAFSVAIMFVVPELAQSPLIFMLWLSVAVIATGGFIAGRQLRVASQQA